MLTYPGKVYIVENPSGFFYRTKQLDSSILTNQLCVAKIA